MDPISGIVSGLSLSVIIAVSIVLFFNVDHAKKNVDGTLRDVVDQINDSQYYAYKFDKKQEDNIRNLDTNIQRVNNKVKTLDASLKDEVSKLYNSTVSKDEIETGVKHIKTNKLQLGDEYLLSGEGDAHSGNKPDGWLRLFDKDGKDYKGGFATGKLYVRDESSFNGPTNINGTLNIKGGDSVFNPNGQQPTLFRGPDNKNYIRGDTELTGNTTNIGDMNINKNINVGGRIFFKDPSMNTAPTNANGTDSYYMEKVMNEHNKSSLRVTLQDDADENFQIWGGGGAVGSVKHSLNAAGDAWHQGWVDAEYINGRNTITTRDWSTWMRSTGDMHASKSLGVGISPDNAKDWRFFVDGKQGAGATWQTLFRNNNSHVYVAHDNGHGVHIKNEKASGAEAALGVYSANGELMHVGNNGDIRIGRSDGGGQVTANAPLKVQRHIDSKIDWVTPNDRALFAGWMGKKIVLGNNAQNGHDFAAYQTPQTDVVVSINPTYVHNTLKVARNKDDAMPASMPSGIHTTNVYANNGIAVGTAGAVSASIDKNQICLEGTCITHAELAKLKALAR